MASSPSTLTRLACLASLHVLLLSAAAFSSLPGCSRTRLAARVAEESEAREQKKSRRKREERVHKDVKRQRSRAARFQFPGPAKLCGSMQHTHQCPPRTECRVQHDRVVCGRACSRTCSPPGTVLSQHRRTCPYPTSLDYSIGSMAFLPAKSITFATLQECPLDHAPRHVIRGMPCILLMSKRGPDGRC